MKQISPVLHCLSWYSSQGDKPALNLYSLTRLQNASREITLSLTHDLFFLVVNRTMDWWCCVIRNGACKCADQCLLNVYYSNVTEFLSTCATQSKATLTSLCLFTGNVDCYCGVINKHSVLCVCVCWKGQWQIQRNTGARVSSFFIQLHLLDSVPMSVCVTHKVALGENKAEVNIVFNKHELLYMEQQTSFGKCLTLCYWTHLKKKRNNESCACRQHRSFFN